MGMVELRSKHRTSSRDRSAMRGLNPGTLVELEIQTV